MIIIVMILVVRLAVRPGAGVPQGRAVQSHESGPAHPEGEGISR